MNMTADLSKKNTGRKTLFLSILILVYYLLDLYLRTKNGPSLFLIWSGLGYSGIMYVLFRKQIKVRYLYLFSFILLSMLTSSFFTNNMELLGIFFNIQYLGIAYILNESKLNVNIITALVYIYILFFFYHIFLGTDPNQVFFSSRNHISTVLINILMIYYITLDKNGKKVNILPILFVLIISVWSVSRAAIFSMVLLFLGLFFLKLYQKKEYHVDKDKNRKIINIFSRAIFLLISIVLIVFLLRNLDIVKAIIDSIINSFKMLQFRFHRESYISFSRLGIITSYISEVSGNIKNLVFGVELSNTQSFIIYSNNVHNSFLTAHMYFGLLGFLGIVIMIFFSIVKYLKQKNWLYLIMFATVLFRASTDIIAFPGYLDSVIYFFILNGLNGVRISMRKTIK